MQVAKKFTKELVMYGFMAIMFSLALTSAKQLNYYGSDVYEHNTTTGNINILFGLCEPRKTFRYLNTKH